MARRNRMPLLLAIVVLLVVATVAAVRWQHTAPPPADDPYGMAARCPWFDPDELAMQWTYYLLTDDGSLVYVGFAGRLHDPSGAPFAGVNLVVLDRNRDVVRLWNRYPPEALEVRDTDLDVVLGPNRIRRVETADGPRYECHLELDDDGRKITLDAAVLQTTSSCRDGGYELLSWDERGHHFEYEVPLPRGDLSGTLRLGDQARPLAGSGYLESIRWLRSELARPVTWFWGFAHAGPHTLLFFKPGDYPHVKTLLTLSRGAECVASLPGAELRVSAPEDALRAFALIYGGDDLDVALRVDTTARRVHSFPIFVAPFELKLRHGEERQTHHGQMVFEVGKWSHF